MRPKFWGDFIVAIATSIALMIGYLTNYFRKTSGYSEIEKILIIVLVIGVIYNIRRDMDGANKWEAMSAMLLGLVFIVAVIVIAFV